MRRLIMDNDNLFASPRLVADISSCYFYHVMDLPGHGQVGGEWDLRGGEDAYLGGVSFAGKRVLELGTASGFLCRHMESRGAEVVAFDLPAGRSWDLVPLAGIDLPGLEAEAKEHVERMKNGWWLAHRLLGSRAKVVYGDIYDIPEALGPVDIATFGSILLHLRDPFQALLSASRLTRETIIVTDVHPEQPANESPTVGRVFRGLKSRVKQLLIKTGTLSPTAPHPGTMYFMPNPRAGDLEAEVGTWWLFTPEVICRFLAVLGFGDHVITEHFQTYQGKRMRLYTVVANRTRPM